MRWNITEECGRPICEEQIKWDNEKQEAVFIEPQKEVDCLCVLKFTQHKEPITLTYVLDKDMWKTREGDYIVFDAVEKWCLLSDISNMLDGKPEPLWCWEFGHTLADTAIPALDKWIQDGVSYVNGLTPEEWREILTKIKMAFEVSKSDLDGALDDIADIAERDRILKEHDKIREEGFSLMSKYYLDLWD